MQKNKKISYIKKPLAKNSLIGLPCAVLALLCCVCSMTISIRLQGQGGVNVAAWGFSSMVFAAFGLWYGVHGLLEKEKNYILARIGVAISGLLAVAWISLIIVGIFGK